jgi:4-hydroxy-2-oxoheptanedioate aldolase
MRVNTAKEKMLRGEPAFGYSLGLGSALVAERIARTGIDWLLIDNQHGSWGPDSTIAALMAIEGGTAIPMARVARNDYTMIGRLLDEGMLGIVVPMVHTVEDAKAAADACRFPPRGNRSWGWARAATLGDDYPTWINDQIFVAVQIESAQAVEYAEAIMAVPGVDGCWMGPGDLAFSMGIHPSEQTNHEGHRRAIERVVQVCRNTGKIPGFASETPEQALDRASQGFQFLTSGSDTEFVLQGALNGVAALKSLSRR